MVISNQKKRCAPYHSVLHKLNLRPHRCLEDDLQVTSVGMSYAEAPKRSAAGLPLSAASVAPPAASVASSARGHSVTTAATTKMPVSAQSLPRCRLMNAWPTIATASAASSERASSICGIRTRPVSPFAFQSE